MIKQDSIKMKRNVFLSILLMGLFYLINFNSLNAQDFEWARQFADTENDEGRSIAVDASGNVYTAGIFTGTVDFDPGPGVHKLIAYDNIIPDIFISKLDSSGNFVWVKKLGGLEGEGVTSMVIDESGNVYTTGSFTGYADFDPGAAYYPLHATGTGYYPDIFISKLDSSGNFVWAKQMGGSSYEYGEFITLDNSGNIYSIGAFYNTTDFDPGPQTYNLTALGLTDIYISKLDTSGTFVWAKQIGGTNFDFGTSIDIDGTGNIYIAGSFIDTVDFDPGPGVHNLIAGSYESIFMSKLNASGDFVWAKQFDGTFQDKVIAMTLDEKGNVFTTGSFFDSTDFDPGIDTCYLTSAGSDDVFISKLESAGNFVWAKQLGGDFYDESYAIATDASGNVYTAGFFYALADFDPGTGSYNLTPVGLLDIFINKLDSSGNFVWARQFGGAQVEYCNSIALDPGGKVYSTGCFEGTTDFDPGTGIYNLISAGDYDIFVHKMMPNLNTNSKKVAPAVEVTISPNPTTGEFIVNIPSLKQDEFTMKVINRLGIVVFAKNYQYSNNAEHFSANISVLPNGIYTLLIQQGNTVLVRNVVLSK
jgi:hypothetical protein